MTRHYGVADSLPSFGTHGKPLRTAHVVRLGHGRWIVYCLVNLKRTTTVFCKTRGDASRIAKEHTGADRIKWSDLVPRGILGQAETEWEEAHVSP